MEGLKRRASEISFYLQRLMEPTIFSEVQDAVARKDRESFVNACKKVKIPGKYITVIMTILFTIPLQLTWPPP